MVDRGCMTMEYHGIPWSSDHHFGMGLKLDMQHRGLNLYKVCINDELGLTLTYFTAMSNLVACVNEWGKRLESNLIGKTSRNDKIDRIFMFMKTF